jgi:hypothetical protein
MKLKSALLLSCLFLLLQNAMGQCELNPTITGDTLLCPDEGGLLQTQVYDSYQWYKRYFLDNSLELIPGATGQSLAVTFDDVPYYFVVEVTQDTCTDSSPEVLVDGLAFLLPFVEHTGDFTFNPATESFVICEGDTMFLTLGIPYDTNITWYKNGSPIPNETSNILAVTDEGAYTVEGAPAICPNFIQPLGLILNVTIEDCSTATQPEPGISGLKIFPNPAADFVNIEMENGPYPLKVSVQDATGRTLDSWESNGGNVQFSLATWQAGMYFLKIWDGKEFSVHKLIKQ